jgi:Tfp pilus assembly protein PilF
MSKLLCFVALFGLAGSTCVRPKGDPAKSETRLALARDFLLKNQLEAAEAEANKALGYLPTNEEAYNLRGLVHHLRAAKAMSLVEVEGCLTGLDADVLRQEIEQELGLAQADFEKAYKLAPEFGEAWSNAGTAVLLLGDPDGARARFEQALANPARLLSPGLTRANLGWAFFEKKDLVSAGKELRQAIQFQPGMCVATYRLGRVYFAREEWEKAAEQFQEVSDQPDCKSQEAALYLMKARLEQGLLDEARAAQAICLTRGATSCMAAQCRTASFDRGGAE